MSLSKNRRGIVATIDFVFAITIILLVLAAFTLAQEQEYPGLAHTRISRDILSSLEEQGFLASLDSETIKEEMKNLVPKNLDTELNITCYNHCSDIGSPCSQEFYQKNSQTISLYSTEKQEPSVVEKYFYISQPKPLYCIANMEVWDK